MHGIGHAEEDINVQPQYKMWSDSACQNCGRTDLQSYQNVVLLIVLKSLKTMKLG